METNSIRKRGLPIWEYLSLPAHFRTVITIWKHWSPYGKHSHMVIFTSIPKWAQTLFGNRLVTEPSPFGNRDPFLCGDPHIEMGICSICFPIWKRGSKERLHFHMGMCLSPFPYGNHHMETGSRVIGLPIWKRGFTLSIWGCFYPRFHMVRKSWFPVQNLGEDALQCVTWRLPKMRSPFLYGEPPYGNGQGESDIPIWGVPVLE